ERQLRRLADHGVVTTPPIVARISHDAGPDRIEDDVPRQLQQVGMPLHHLAAKPTLEQMTFVAVPPVEPLRVDAVQPMHPTRYVCVRRLHEKVIVVRHQAVRMAAPFERRDDLSEQLQESESVARVREYCVLAIPASRYVVDRAGNLRAGRARHLPTVAASPPSVRAWHQFGAETARIRLGGTCPGARHEDTSRQGGP